jgi:hypothetical protein
MNRRQFLKVAACGAAALMPNWLQALDTMSQKRNVLFIVVDDLRPELGCFGYTEWRKNKDDEVVARELYDHAAGDVARRNLADDAEFAADGKRLQQLLRIGWRGALP